MNSLLKTTWNTVFRLTGLDFSFGVIYHDWSFYLIELRADYQGVTDLLGGAKVAPSKFGANAAKLQIVVCDMRRVLIGHQVSGHLQKPVVLTKI